jgi:sortase A
VIYQRIENRGFERRMHEPSGSQPKAGSQGKGRSALGNGELMGRLMVPRLHLRAMVREGTDDGTLGLALGHIPGTALPGQNGNVGIAGHRDTLFRSLREIRKDDLIQLQTLRGDYLYRVRTIEVVPPQSVSVLQAGHYPEITLVTCYPFHYVGPAPDRFIVKASLVTNARVQQVAPAGARKTALAGPKRVPFQVYERHSRELVPGISIGLSWADPGRHLVNGWMWVMPDRRTIWLRNQRAMQPVVFYGYDDGKQRRLVITNVAAKSVSGYLLVPDGPRTSY